MTNGLWSWAADSEMGGRTMQCVRRQEAIRGRKARAAMAIIVFLLPSGTCFASEPVPMQERSEEHTSELQSRLHLVCRLLLEKKKKTIQCIKIKKINENTGKRTNGVNHCKNNYIISTKTYPTDLATTILYNEVIICVTDEYHA